MSPLLVLPTISLCFKPMKNPFPLFAFVEKSCGTYKGRVSYGPILLVSAR